MPHITATVKVHLEHMRQRLVHLGVLEMHLSLWTRLTTRKHENWKTCTPFGFAGYLLWLLLLLSFTNRCCNLCDKWEGNRLPQQFNFKNVSHCLTNCLKSFTVEAIEWNNFMLAFNDVSFLHETQCISPFHCQQHAIFPCSFNARKLVPMVVWLCCIQNVDGMTSIFFSFGWCFKRPAEIKSGNPACGFLAIPQPAWITHLVINKNASAVTFQNRRFRTACRRTDSLIPSFRSLSTKKFHSRQICQKHFFYLQTSSQQAKFLFKLLG